ncbi:hypothetical protein J3F84DRAFT_135802 [Trichoderma pleuroticola]
MDVGSRPSQRFRGPAGPRTSLPTMPYPDGQSCDKIEDFAVPNSRCGATGSCKTMELEEEEHQTHSHHPPKAFGNCGYESHPHLFPAGFSCKGPVGDKTREKNKKKKKAVGKASVSRHGRQEFQCQDGGNN